VLTEHSSTRTLKPDDPNNADNSTQYGYYSVEGSSTMICDKFPRMVVETAPGPGTAAIMRQIQDRAAAILLQQNGKQFSYTIAGFGFSSSFCIPLVAVWAAHTPEFFKGLTLPTRFRRGEILSACSIPPHTGPPSPAVASSPGGPQLSAGPPPAHAATSDTHSPPVPQPILFNSRYPSRDKAIRLLFGSNDDSLSRCKTIMFYERVLEPYFLGPIVPLCHGSNISVTASEERSSLGVFLAPEDNPRLCHLLTARHALGATPAVGTSFQTVSSLDVLRELARAVRPLGGNPQEQEERCAAVFSRIQQSVAILVAEAIGVDANGWREDWALARVAQGFVGSNGDWDAHCLQSEEIQILLETEAPVDRGLLLGHAQVGDTVLKIGASTGTTRGVVNGTNLFTYYKRLVSPTSIATAAITDTHQDITIDYATFVVIFKDNSTFWQQSFSASGDCGGGVYKFVGGQCTLVGMLVGLDCAHGGGFEDVGLMVPQEELLAQMEKKTGKR